MSIHGLALRFAALLAIASPFSAIAQNADEPPEVLAPEYQADEAPPPPVIQAQTAALRGLDKLTGAVVEFDLGTGTEGQFQRLRIEVKTCQMRGPEHAVFMKIFDTGRPTGLDMVFSGWMFASSPALSALDHPRYDVWLQSCKTS